jgi:glycerol kinase
VAGVPVREVVAGGGLSSSDTLLQLQADLSGVPVRRMADQDRASLRGAAFLAGSDGLLWSELAEARATLPEGNLFIPKTSEAERQDRRARWHSLTDEEVARVQSGHYH